MEDAPENEVKEERFALMIIRRTNKKTGKVQILLKTRADKLPMPEVVLILEEWLKKVREKIVEPFTRNLNFSNKKNGD